MYRCPACDCGTFTFYNKLIDSYENKLLNQSAFTYEYQIVCAKCGEVQTKQSYVFSKYFGEKPSDDEIFAKGSEFLAVWRDEKDAETLRADNEFNNCPACMTSRYVSVEARNRFVKVDDHIFSKMVYRCVCHNCHNETLQAPTPQAAIDIWNNIFPMEDGL